MESVERALSYLLLCWFSSVSVRKADGTNSIEICCRVLLVSPMNADALHPMKAEGMFSPGRFSNKSLAEPLFASCLKCTRGEDGFPHSTVDNYPCYECLLWCGCDHQRTRSPCLHRQAVHSHVFLVCVVEFSAAAGSALCDIGLQAIVFLCGGNSRDGALQEGHLQASVKAVYR